MRDCHSRGSPAPELFAPDRWWTVTGSRPGGTLRKGGRSQHRKRERDLHQLEHPVLLRGERPSGQLEPLCVRRTQRAQEVQDQYHDQDSTDNAAAADRTIAAIAKTAAGQQQDEKNDQKQGHDDLQVFFTASTGTEQIRLQAGKGSAGTRHLPATPGDETLDN
jgi:hypothetical protein